MKTYKAYCFDLDGTVYRGKEPIESAIEVISNLQQKGVEPFFVTNNSSKTRVQIKDNLRSFGLEVPIEHIYSSAVVTAQYVKENYPNAKVYVIGADGIREELQLQNIELATDEESIVDVVIMGIDRSITYDKLAHVCKLIQDGAVLIGSNPDVQFPIEQYFLPGCGSFVQLVANVCKVEPIFIGKPSTFLLKSIAQSHQFLKEEIIMIGDNYHTDILSGIRFGCDTIFVGTGVTSIKELEKVDVLPTYIVNQLSELFLKDV